MLKAQSSKEGLFQESMLNNESLIENMVKELEIEDNRSLFNTSNTFPNNELLFNYEK